MFDRGQYHAALGFCAEITGTELTVFARRAPLAPISVTLDGHKLDPFRTLGLSLRQLTSPAGSLLGTLP